MKTTNITEAVVEDRVMVAALEAVVTDRVSEVAVMADQMAAVAALGVVEAEMVAVATLRGVDERAHPAHTARHMHPATGSSTSEINPEKGPGKPSKNNLNKTSNKTKAMRS